MAAREQQRLANQRSRSVARRCGEQCFVCQRRLLTADQRLHRGARQNCVCPFHVECLLRSMQNGRDRCDCEQPLSTQDLLTVIVPRAEPADEGDRQTGQMTGSNMIFFHADASSVI